MNRWPVLALVLLALAAIPSQGSAARAKHGVKAQVKRGTLTLTGGRKADSVTLRIKGRSLLVDVQSNGSADFKFKRKAVKRVVVNGGRGRDRLVFRGANVAESVTLSSKRVRMGSARSSADAAAAARVPISARALESVRLSMGGGADAVGLGDLTGTGLRAVSVELGPLTGDGQPDTLTVGGTAGADALTAVGGSSTFTLSGLPWSVSAANVEGGRDLVTVNGSGGNDTLSMSGSGDPDVIALSAIGGVARTGIVGSTTVDSVAVEALRLSTFGGPDTVTLGDLTGTGATVALDIGAGDGWLDRVTVNGGPGPDAVSVAGGASGIEVSGGTPASITGAEPGDFLTVDGQGGADTLNASGLAANVVGLTLRGGLDEDTLTGSEGDDAFPSSPGDGADVVQGGPGADRVVVDGADGPDSFTLSAIATGARLDNDGFGAVDMAGIEAASINPRGGADSVAVDQLEGTGLATVLVDFGLVPGGSADGQADEVSFDGTAGNDTVLANSTGSPVTATGLGVTAMIDHADAAQDRLTIRSLAGNDSLDASGVAANRIGLTLDSGEGDDAVLGSDGDDIVATGTGGNTASLGDGDDTLVVSNPSELGQDTVDGEGGTGDRVVFQGAATPYGWEIFGGASHVVFRRNALNLADLQGFETVDLRPGGGNDGVTVRDLTGTDITQVNVDLAAPGGGSDVTQDRVTVEGTGGDDSISIAGDAAGTSVTGLTARIDITGTDTFDGLVVFGLGGDDGISASGLKVSGMRLTLYGDDLGGFVSGDDTLIGGDGDDTLHGGDGADALVGGPGSDALDAGGDPGDIEIQDG